MNFHSQSPEWQAPLTIHQPPAPTSPPRGPPPTSAPKSNSSPEKKLKLRASCDACAASKVKCSKEHPICARCKTNRSQCIYGVSRKHGKPGRTRKRNPDGTPFVKASKQRPSPDGSEFSKFRVRPEPLNHGDAIFDASAQWSPTPSWSSNTDFEFEMTPEPMFLEPPTTDFAYMDNMMPTTPPELTHMPMLQPELTFVDPFARKQSVMLDLPDVQAIKDFVSHDVSTAPPMDFSFAEQMPMEHNYQAPPPPPLSTSATSSPQSTNSLPPPMYNPLRVSISMPSSHCCYTLAYSTLESLRIINPENSTGVELKSLDSVLSITKSAVANVRQLLNCSCSADPHLAMLYSSITSKILTWYQIAAGVKPAATTFPSAPPSLSDASSPSSSVFGSPLSTPGAEHTTFDIQVKPLKMGVFEFDEEQQAMLRRQVVLRELKKCGTLVDALVDWKGEGGKPAQSEFLYDVLGTWLKTELLKTLTEVESEYCQGL